MSQYKTTAHRSPRRRKTPWTLRGLRLVFALLNRISPYIGARLAYRLWFKSPRFAEPPREARWRQSARTFLLEHEHGPLAVYQWGQGPAVLLVHGWSGRGTQMGAFSGPLVKRGFSVVAFDAPGHGRSQGTQTNAFEVAAAVQAVAKEVGPVSAIVAHSYGTMASVLALKQGLQVGKVVCISSPTSLLFLIDSFRRTFAIGEKILQRFKALLERDFGPDIWERVASDILVADSQVPALIIHDKNDRDVPWQWSERLANAWPGSHLWLTQSLGHRRILRSPAVLEAVSEFIVSNQLPNTESDKSVNGARGQ